MRGNLIILLVLLNVVFFTVSSSYGSEILYTGNDSSNEDLSSMEAQNSKVEVSVSNEQSEEGVTQTKEVPLPVPDATNNFLIEAAELANPVKLIVTTIPATLRVGEQGYLQVHLIPNTTISIATLQAIAGSDALQITPESVVLTNLVPPTSESAPEKSPPDPPVLGAVPLVNFHVKVLRVGVFPATIEFRTDLGVQKLQIFIKGE